MPIENERKFHLKNMPPHILRNRLINMGVDHTVQKIQQTYLIRDKARGYVSRVRSVNSDGETKYIETKKIGFGEKCREVETEISYESYKELVSYFSIGDTISKTRYVIPMSNGTKWEVDVYSHHHDGLMVAEIELPTPDTKIEFHPLLGNDLVDVTDEVKFKNWYLAGIN